MVVDSGYHLELKILVMIIKVQYTPQQAEPKFYRKNNLANCKMSGNFQNIKPDLIWKLI